MSRPAVGRAAVLATDARWSGPEPAGPPAASRWWVAATMLGVAGLLAFLALTPLPPFASDVYTSLVRRYLVVGAVLAGYLVWLIARRRLPRPSPFDLPLAAVVLAGLIAVPRSIDPRVSLEAVLSLLPALVLFYIVHDIQALDARRLSAAVVLAAVAVALPALASALDAFGEWWSLVRAIDGRVGPESWLPPRSPRVSGVGNHPNILGALFAMALPAALLLALDARRRALRVVILLGALVLTLALFFTLSRAAWIAAVAGLAAMAIALLAGARVRPRIPRAAWIAVAAVAVVGVVALTALVLSDARPEWLFRDSLGPRADMRRAGWAMFRDNPLTGAGPGTFVALYPLYGGTHPFAAVHAHNDTVQTALETGLVGLAAGASLLAALAVCTVAGLRNPDPSTRRGVAAGAGILVALLVHGLADAPLSFPETLFAGAIALVMIARGADGPLGVALERAGLGGLPRRVLRALAGAGRAGPLLAVALAAVLPVAWFVTSRAHVAYDRSIAYAADERWPEAVRAARTAVERDDRLAIYWYGLGAAHASAAIDDDRRAEQERALAAYRRGLELHPHDGAALVSYAALNVALGRPEAARAALPALARLAGRDSLLLLAHATLTQWTEPPERAVETYAGLLVLNPSLAGTPFWRVDPFRAATFDRIVDRALARVSEVAGDGPAGESLRTSIRLYAGRGAPSPEALQAALAARPGDIGLRVAAGRLLSVDERTRPEARALLRGAVRLKGDDPAARAALGDLYALDGDIARARREWAAASYLDDLGATVSLGNSFAPGSVPAAVRERGERLLQAAEIGRFYLIFQTERFTFQRHEPIPIILPGDWLLALPDAFEQWKAAVEGWE